MLQVFYDSPCRTPTWAWERAIAVREAELRTAAGQPALATDHPPPARRLDRSGFPWIEKAIKFQTRRALCLTLAQERALASKMPDVFQAYEIYNDPQLHPTRYQIEAYLLARCSDHEIAYHTGLGPAVVAAFEGLFYNVREKLDREVYILHTAIGQSVYRGLSGREADILWKLYGYYIGPLAVRALASGFTNPSICPTRDALSGAFQDDTIATQQMKASLAAKTVQINSYTQLELLNVFNKFVEIERNTDSAGKAQNQFLMHVEAMFAALPFSIGGRNPRGGPPIKTALQPYEDSAVELSYEEMCQVAMGHPLPNGQQLLEMRFPDPV